MSRQPARYKRYLDDVNEPEPRETKRRRRRLSDLIGMSTHTSSDASAPGSAVQEDALEDMQDASNSFVVCVYCFRCDSLCLYSCKQMCSLCDILENFPVGS